jgi:hypothetical protein
MRTGFAVEDVLTLEASDPVSPTGRSATADADVDAEHKLVARSTGEPLRHLPTCSIPARCARSAPPHLASDIRSRSVHSLATHPLELSLIPVKMREPR